MIDIKSLQHMVALFETGTVTAGAQRMNIAQPTMTAHLVHLEAKLGEQLFDRSTKGLEPTPMGRAFYTRAKDMLAQWADFDSEMRFLAGSDIGDIRVCCGAVLEMGILPNAIVSLLQSRPSVNVKVDVFDPEKMLHRLRNGDADIAVGFFDDLFDDNLEQIKVPGQRMGFYVRPEHPILQQAIASQSLEKFELAAPYIPKDVGNWLGQHGLSGAKRNIASDSYVLLKRVACQTDLMVGGPKFLFYNEVSQSKLVELPIQDSPMWEASILISSAAKYSRLVRAFVDCIEQELLRHTDS